MQLDNIICRRAEKIMDDNKRQQEMSASRSTPTTTGTRHHHHGCRLTMAQQSISPRTTSLSMSFRCQLLLGLVLSTIPSACAFSESDLDHLSSSRSSQSSSILSASTDSSPSSPSSSSSSTTLTLRSNLSCFVCSTIEDMRCKFINETIRHLEEFASNTVRPSSTSSHEEHPMLSSYGSGSAMPSSTELFDQDQDSSMTSGEYMTPVSSNEARYGDLGHECLPEDQYCMVRSLGVSKEGNTHEFNFFALERNCVKTCTPGCFIIGNGERTKLSFCTTCCTGNYCNVGSGAISDWRRALSCPYNVAITASAITIALSIITSLFQL